MKKNNLVYYIILFLLILTSCNDKLSIQDIINVANQTCINANETYMRYNFPTITNNYYEFICLAKDRQTIHTYIYLQEEIQK